MCRRWKRGADQQAIGRSRGGRTTKLHAVVDGIGRMIGFLLTAGQRHDIRSAPALIEALPAAERLMGDIAYDSDGFRQFLIDRGTTPVIKLNPRRKHLHPFDEQAYKDRNLVERALSRLKDWRRFATRYDKLARNYQATIALAALIIWWA